MRHNIVGLQTGLMGEMTTDSKLVIFGAWYLGDVIAELAESAGYHLLGFVDPDPPPGKSTLQRVPDDAEVFVAIGDNSVRKSISEKLRARGRNQPSLVHPSAVISASAQLGEACYVGENVVLRALAKVGHGCLINAGAVVSHHCTVGNFASLGPNVTTSGRVTIGDECLIGAGATIRPNTEIASCSIVGAGSVVVKPVAQQSLVIGNPAKPVVFEPSSYQHSNWSDNDIW